MSQPRVAILLLNWNGWKDTVECLESVFRLDYDNFFVVVCDNASTDGSIAKIQAWSAGIAASPPVTEPRRDQPGGAVLAAPIPMVELTRAEAEAGIDARVDSRLVLVHNGGNLGFAQGNNVGLRYLVARRDVEYVWILNNDVVVDRACLAELMACARSEPRIGCVGATIYEYADPDVVQAAGGGLFSRSHINPKQITTPRRGSARQATGAPTLDFISGASMLVPIDALKAVGFIDESFFIYCEDVDICVRLRALGTTLVHATAAKLWHKGGSTFGHRSVRHDYYTVRNTLALVRKHYPVMLPAITAYLIYRAVLPKIVRRQWARLAATWRGYRDFRNNITGPIPI